MKAKLLSAKAALVVAFAAGFLEFVGTGRTAYYEDNGIQRPKFDLTAGQKAIESALFALAIFLGIRVIQWGVRRKLRFTGRLPEDDAALHAKSTES
jgi:hypothetical protein